MGEWLHKSDRVENGSAGVTRVVRAAPAEEMAAGAEPKMHVSGHPEARRLPRAKSAKSVERGCALRLVLQILEGVWLTAKDVLPVVVVLTVLQVLIFRRRIENLQVFILGVALAILGLYCFLKGTALSLIPLGNEVGRSLVILDNIYLIAGLVFILGYASTLVEPALQALALEVEEVSIGAIPKGVLIQGVAVGFGAGLSIGILKILQKIPSTTVIIPMLAVAIVLSWIAPEEFVGIAFDCASATTGPVNIPINMAIAIGLSRVVGGADPLLNGFGIIGLTSLGSVLSVLILGIVTRR